MKLPLKLHFTVIKPKYKTKQYYKKCVTQKTLETKHKNIIHKTLLFDGFLS